MGSFDQLELVTEISATLLGFVAVFIALSNTKGRFRESDRHFVQSLVLTSALCIILGLAPRALAPFALQDVWFYANIMGAVGGLLVSSIMLWTQMRMPDEERATVNVFWHVPPWGVGVLTFVLISLGFMNPDRAEDYYVAAVSFLVGNPVWCFIAIVFRRFF